jgi:hypothetical protein
VRVSHCPFRRRARPEVCVILPRAGRLAQLVERLPYTQVAAGSSPAPPMDTGKSARNRVVKPVGCPEMPGAAASGVPVVRSARGRCTAGARAERRTLLLRLLERGLRRGESASGQEAEIREHRIRARLPSGAFVLRRSLRCRRHSEPGGRTVLVAPRGAPGRAIEDSWALRAVRPGTQRVADPRARARGSRGWTPQSPSRITARRVIVLPMCRRAFPHPWRGYVPNMTRAPVSHLRLLSMRLQPVLWLPLYRRLLNERRRGRRLTLRKLGQAVSEQGRRDYR